MQSVLVLDGNQRSALAVTRSLGRRGIRVVVGDTAARSLAGASRFAAAAVSYPSPLTDAGAFVSAVKDLVASHRIGVLLPMTDVTTAVVLRKREALGDVRVPGPSSESFHTLSDKWLLLERARRLAIPAPETVLVRRAEDVAQVEERLRFPVVAKPRASWSEVSGRWVRGSVSYLASPEALRALVVRSHALLEHGLLVQELVRGQGQGVFALYEHGRPVVFFAHRRLRERPPAGGVSVLSESVAVDPALRCYAERLLDEVGWHGVAMVEFKVSRDGRPYLMEVNGRFWGSLQLAVDAGLDFPYALYALASGDRLSVASDYRYGVKSHWLLGDIDHLYLRLFKPEVGHRRSMRDALRAVGGFLAALGPGVREDVHRWDDFGPSLHEIGAYFRIAHK